MVPGYCKKTWGLEIYFENEENRKVYMEMELEDKKILAGNDTDDYIADG